MISNLPKSLTTVTTLSKFVALALFVALPFIGFIIGMQYANEVRPEEAPIIVPIPDIQPPITPTPTIEDIEPKIIVEYPVQNDIVSSPLVVEGKAKGTWFFEGDFPIRLYLGSNKLVDKYVEGYAVAKGEWMTTDYVEFEATIEFPTPSTNNGILVLQKNNPSDLEENNEEISINVKFE